MHPDKHPYLQAATNIAFKICRDAIWADDRCNWITSHVEDIGGYPKTYFRSLDASVYSGTAGVAYFLSALHSANPDPLLKATCYGAIRQALSQAHQHEPATSLSFFSGKLGIAYSSIKAGEHHKDQQLINEGVVLLKECLTVPLEQCGLDVIDGCAGALPVLLSLYETLEFDDIHTCAIKIGDHILAQGHQEPIGISWNTTPFKKHNLTGFAHGVAGMTNALLELYRFTGEEKYKLVAMEGIAYENHYFSESEQNWPDFRSFGETAEQNDAPSPCSCAWCHGAPGIGLSRLRAYALTGEEKLRRDALAAIQTTLKNNVITPYSNFSLCHGLFGNAELLLEASTILDKPEWKHAAEHIGVEGIKNYIDLSIPFTNGVNNSYENPEFMTGTSGMGYFYLRLFDAVRFPSLLAVCQRDSVEVNV